MQHKREVYDRGNGATVLLYNSQKQSVVLVRQFRIATWVNGNADGMLIETCVATGMMMSRKIASAKRRLKRPAIKKVKNVRKVFQLYMSPGGVTEKIVHFFIAEKNDDEPA
ncbi:hypothetical protein ACLK2H_14060 [Escherichia coli]